MPTPPMLDPGDGSLGAPERADPIVALAVALLTLLALALTLGGILAIYDWRTPGSVAPLAFAGAGIFGGTVAILVVAAGVRWARHGRPR